MAAFKNWGAPLVSLMVWSDFILGFYIRIINSYYKHLTIIGYGMTAYKLTQIPPSIFEDLLRPTTFAGFVKCGGHF